MELGWGNKKEIFRMKTKDCKLYEGTGNGDGYGLSDGSGFGAGKGSGSGGISRGDYCSFTSGSEDGTGYGYGLEFYSDPFSGSGPGCPDLNNFEFGIGHG